MFDKFLEVFFLLITTAVDRTLFFRVIVEIERVLPLMAAILIFRCTEGAGVDLILFPRLDSVRLKIKMAAINGKTRSISTISRKNRGL